MSPSIVYIVLVIVLGVSAEDYQRLLFEKLVSLEHKVTSLQSELKLLKETSEHKSAIRATSGQHVVAFSAHRYGDDSLVKDETIVFNAVETNVGNAYNAQLGKFTCPVNGAYFFTVNILSHLNHPLDAYIMREDKAVAGLFTIGAYPTVDDQSASSVVIQCQEGQQVWVKSLGSYLLNGENVGFTQFTGFLVAQDEASVVVG